MSKLEEIKKRNRRRHEILDSPYARVMKRDLVRACADIDTLLKVIDRVADIVHSNSPDDIRLSKINEIVRYTEADK